MAEDKGSKNRDADGNGDEEDLGAGPEGGRIRRGPDSAKSLKYSQEVTSTEDEPERAGRSLATTHHEVIKEWAEERERAFPASAWELLEDGHVAIETNPVTGVPGQDRVPGYYAVVRPQR